MSQWIVSIRLEIDTFSAHPPMKSAAFTPKDFFDRHKKNDFDGAFLRENSENEYPGSWFSPSRLSISFAPDGTTVGRSTSKLYETFAGMLSAAELEQTIISAFETWARLSNINVGVMADSGDPFGTGGPSQGDLRFGDIRVGAVPMAGDVYAVAVPHNEMLSGTWAGDILFNSEAKFADADAIYTVALHEAGHVLGLGHSDNPLSVMHPTAQNSTLHSTDVLAIQDLYGVRALDQYDQGNDRNDTMADAVRIRNTGSVDGRIPLVVFGDIEGAADVDYFYLRPQSEYTGSVTFRVVSDSISTLNPTMQLFDENGTLLGQASGSGHLGNDLSLTLPSVDPTLDYFVQLSATGGQPHDIGSYALVTTIDGKLTEGMELLDQIMRGDYGFLKQNDVQDMFLSDVPAFFNNDLLTNDTIATATPLDELPGATSPTKFRTQGSLFQRRDVDYYSVDAGSGIMTVNVVAQGNTQLIPDLDILDQDGNPVTTRNLVNGNGEQTIQATGLVEDNTYYVRVSADRRSDEFSMGNYLLDVDFNRPEFIPNTLASGNVSRFSNRRIHTMYVAQTQIFHFGLTSGTGRINPNATLYMSVYDELGSLVYRVATRPGERRTSQSVVLKPGSYQIRVTLSNSTFGRNTWISYSVDGLGISDPTGPELVDPSENPFDRCPNDPTQWCYPNDRHSSDPFIIVDGQETTPTTPPTDPDWMDSNQWYWTAGWPI